MYVKFARSLAIILILWILAMVTLITHYELNKKILSPVDYYESILKRYDKKVNHAKHSNFKAWTLMTPINIDHYYDKKFKYTAIAGSDFPPGMEGKPVQLIHRLKNPLLSMVQKGWQDHAFNEFVSDLIPLNRTLFDPRDDWCKKQIYSKFLPQVSVIICFHNEAWSTLLRTVHSVLDKTPDGLLKQIILVDDGSDIPHLTNDLNEYLKRVPKVTLVRLVKREGLIRARILAAKRATAPVIVYLDSHCECAEGWLEPLVDRIVQNPQTVVSPIVDIIHSNTFEYVAQTKSDLRIGGFTWDLKFTWETIPREVLIKRNEAAAPIKTPTISGGLFAIDKEFFKILGYYDDQFEIWGLENLELSFKTWMCGGSLEIVPCSRVGHVFRQRFPYRKPLQSTKKNAVRLAQVWMDEYAKYFYERIGNDLGDFGDVTERKKLRHQMNCKTFDWYLKNVYPQLEVPKDYVASGKIHSFSDNLLCLDAPANPHHYLDGIKLFPCHFQGGNQFWVYTKEGELKRDSFCMEDVSGTPLLNICKGRHKSQMWIYNAHTKMIMNFGSLQCLYAVEHANGWSVNMAPCKNPNKHPWGLENFKVDKLIPELQVYAKRLM